MSDIKTGLKCDSRTRGLRGKEGTEEKKDTEDTGDIKDLMAQRRLSLVRHQGILPRGRTMIFQLAS